MSPVHTRILPPGSIDESRLTYVVIAAREKEMWVFVRHRDRSTWEMPAGHIEKNESADRLPSGNCRGDRDGQRQAEPPLRLPGKFFWRKPNGAVCTAPIYRIGIRNWNTKLWSFSSSLSSLFHLLTRRCRPCCSNMHMSCCDHELKALLLQLKQQMHFHEDFL